MTSLAAPIDSPTATSWRGNLLILAVLTATFMAASVAMDSIIVNNIAKSKDELTSSFAYLVVGSWVGSISGLIFALIVGKKLVDPEFESLLKLKKRFHLQAGISGAIAAMATLIYLYSIGKMDPGSITALKQLVILYSVAFELFTRRVRAKGIIIPATLTIGGGILVSLSDSPKATLLVVVLMVVVSNGLTAAGEFVEQSGVRNADSVSLFVWRFFWLATMATIAAFVVSGLRGYTSELLGTMLDLLVWFPLIALNMFFIFLGMGFRFYIKKISAVSVSLILASLQIALVFPITIIGDWIHNGILGEVPDKPVIWLIRIAGAIFLFLGVYLLQKTTWRLD